jgi:hypothetical protein
LFAYSVQFSATLFVTFGLAIAGNVPRATRSLGFGERDVLSSTNVTKVDNVSIKHNTQIFGARC